MTPEPVADELAQRLSVLIGMIMEDEVDQAVTATPGEPAQLQVRLAALARAGEDIAKLAAAAEVVLRRYHPSAGD